MTKKKATKAKVVDESPKREAPDVQPAAETAEEAVPVLEEATAAETDSEVSEGAESGDEKGKDPETTAATVDEAAGDPEAPAPEAEAGAEAPVEDEKPEVEPEREPEVVPELEPESDPEGVITSLTPKIYEALLKKWQVNGNPRTFNAHGGTWSVYTEGDGYKFVAVKQETGLGLYNDLSTG